MRAQTPRPLAGERRRRPRRRFEAGPDDEAEQGPAKPEPIPEVGPAQWVDDEHLDEVVDLLNPRPAVVVDVARLRRALGFGFAGGDTARTLREAMRRAPLAASDWEPICFEEDLFVPDLIRISMPVRIEGFEPVVDRRFLGRLLTSPPRDLDVVAFRREVLGELAASPELRGRFQDVYRAIYRLRELFEPDAHSFDVEGTGRRLETLGALRDVIEGMASGFAECESGLGRIHRYAARAKETDGYQRLVELLDYDNNLASVDLKLRVGADGRVRRFEIQKVTENRANRFYQSPIGRWLTRVGLMFRGYLFSEGELVNRWVDSVFDGVEGLVPPLLQLLGEMELYLSGLAFKDLAESKELAVCFPELLDGDADAASWRAVELFNPLLYEQKITPVPCDLDSDRWETITIVTGPNSGGKTRLVQAVGIAQMLAQVGLFAPARQAVLRRATGLFVSLIAGAKADQQEGRLGTELIRIRDLFERSRPGWLIVLDELCSGTNPSEGEEIFRLVLSLLRELRPRVWITTHFLSFAARLEEEDGEEGALRFLQVDLDDHQQATFHFVPGVAETSLAHQTAARLGVTREELLALVRRSRG